MNGARTELCTKKKIIPIANRSITSGMIMNCLFVIKKRTMRINCLRQNYCKDKKGGPGNKKYRPENLIRINHKKNIP